MLKRFYIDNFKSLAQFNLPAVGEPPLGQFVCLIGLNGSGKSTVLQALDFLSQVNAGTVQQWLARREWESSALTSAGSAKRLINFRITFGDAGKEIDWEGAFNSHLLKCTSETISINGDLVLKSSDGVVTLGDGQTIPVTFEYQGSVLSALRIQSLSSKRFDPKPIFLLSYFLRSVKSLELLSPNLLRKPSREAVDVGAGGERLAAFVYGMSREEKTKLFEALSTFYPHVRELTATATKYGWKRIRVVEDYGSSLKTEARHLNDGMLRVMAILAQTIAEGGADKFRKATRLSTDHKNDIGSLDHKNYEYILLDEVENGINPEIIQRLVKYLLKLKQQIIVTTHSPLILNYLPEGRARESVVLLFRNKAGSPFATRFFSIDHVGKKLEIMGPGEAFADTALERLTEILSAENDQRLDA